MLCFTEMRNPTWRRFRMFSKSTRLRLDIVVLLLFLYNFTVIQAESIISNYGIRRQSNWGYGNMMIDTANGNLYVGLENELLHLSPNLESIKRVETGPRMDNNECLDLKSLNNITNTCIKYDFTTGKLENMTNYNQILAIDRRRNRLIVCGTLYQGSCQTTDLDDISKMVSYPFGAENMVASNNPEQPTVGFIASGPFNDDMLYVGSSLASVNLYTVRKNSIGVISSRYLAPPDKIFRFASGDDGATRASLKSTTATIQFTYVSGFSTGGFSYFFGTYGGFSKVVQICNNDKYFDSYADMNIACDSYNTVQSAILLAPGSRLAASLSMSSGQQLVVGLFSSSPSDASSAVCVFKLSDIRAKFTENIKNCYTYANSSVSSYYDETGLTCTQNLDVTIDGNFCGINNFRPSEGQRNSPLSSSTILTRSPIITLPATQLTGVTYTVVDNTHTVLFLGTMNGEIKKIVLNSAQGASVYETVPIDLNNPLHADMIMGGSSDFLYTMSQNKIFKVSVTDCTQYKTCDQCLQVQNPYCGWCTLENRCSRSQNCSNPGLAGRWLSKLNSAQAMCPALLGVNPPNMDIIQDSTVTLSISNLPRPQPGENYKCTFDSFSASATFSDDQLVCPTPPTKPQLSGSTENVTLTISITISSFNVVFLQAPLTFYSCALSTLCSRCTSSPWSCRFCLSNNKCQHSMAACSETALQSQSTCPSITPDGKEILMLSGETRDIQVDANNLPAPLWGVENIFWCEVGSRNFSAIRHSPSSLVCQRVTDTQELKTENLVVKWGNNFRIENTYQVTVYDCNLMANGDCSTCLGLRLNSTTSKFNCVRCNDGICKNVDQCKTENPTCPVAVVTEITPRTGPLEGRTSLTITGTDLGSSDDQVVVKIGGSQCLSVKNEYVVSKRYVCSTPSGSGIKNIDVVVNSRAATMGPDSTFTYQDPQINNLTPTLGPIYGGTKLTLTGTNLNTGATASVYLGQLYQQPCTVIRSESNSSNLVCKTSSASAPATINQVLAVFDNTTRTLPKNFEYTPNPKVDSIQPRSSFQSGGCIITGVGTNLDSGLRLRAQFIGSTSPTVSEVNSGGSNTQLTLTAPKIDTVNPLPGMVVLTFAVDDDNQLQQSINFTIDPDPSFDNFPNGAKTYGENSNDNLQITGRYFNTDCVKSLLKITVGGKTCTVCPDCITEKYIYCTPPDNIYSPVDILGSAPSVVVSVGPLDKNLGSLQRQSTPSLTWQIAVAVIGGVFIIFVILLIVIFTRKSFKSKREYKKLLAQMNALESRVRVECRQAFADLQTEVSDFTSDIHVIGIPFWDFKMYTFKLLFPGSRDHRILHPPNNPKNKHGGFNQKMHQFNQLLSSKYFLLIFIRTLEKQEKEFGMRDRANVASLLMVVLLNKMEYATDIVEVLLSELIDRSMEKKAPKIMLRRTESVVEKLLANWLSLAMYGYIKKHAGPTLFMLFKAIKHQTEKGPVDAVTAEARYSLSEIRLLREKINPNTLAINVVDGDDEKQSPIMCRMLDCDTITQAKEKALDAIHMNAPFSKRPKLHQVDLFWKTGKNAKLPLHDEDKSSVIENGMKHINTLSHYNIPDGSTFELIHKQDSEDSVHAIHGNIEINSGTTPNAITVEIEGSKVCHLTKHDDSQNINRSQKVISEIFLTRLLSTKITLQQYIDDLFKTIFKVDDNLPPVVKYLYDFLDGAAVKHGITDADVVHAWKSNSLPLRFWVNLITNPEFLFDINKSACAESCLSVIAQAFMESCSTYEHRPTKDAPTTKLLFAKDIPRYRQLVEQFYKGVKDLPPLSSKVMNQLMTDLSMTYTADFNLEVALRELYRYATTYNYELLTALENDPSAKKMRFGLRFQQLESLPENDDLGYDEL